jgi:hypothetical protein
MPVSESGRIVIEITPELKQQLYGALKRDGMTLKEWFMRNAQTYLSHNTQLSLKFEEIEESSEVRR